MTAEEAVMVAAEAEVGEPVTIERLDSLWAVVIGRDTGGCYAFPQWWISRVLANPAVWASEQPQRVERPDPAAGVPIPDWGKPLSPEPQREPTPRIARSYSGPRKADKPVERDHAALLEQMRYKLARAELEQGRLSPEDRFVEGIGWLDDRAAAAWVCDDFLLKDFNADGSLREPEPRHDWDSRCLGRLHADNVTAPGWGAVKIGWRLEGHSVRRPSLDNYDGYFD